MTLFQEDQEYKNTGEFAAEAVENIIQVMIQINIERNEAAA